MLNLDQIYALLEMYIALLPSIEVATTKSCEAKCSTTPATG
jgi:hypothetical protein